MSATGTKAHEYASRVIWDGNRGQGTSDYASYGREYRVLVPQKPDLLGSADAMFRGTAERYNPEDLFLAAISSCHMLAYLALCARGGIRVVAYEDEARGTLVLDGHGGGRFQEVALRPRVVVADSKDEQAARDLHATAHAQCFIASSCSVPIQCDATIDVAAEAAR
ncbi:MAG: OsmC family protein [Gemmatimonadaceae bacterium]